MITIYVNTSIFDDPSVTYYIFNIFTNFTRYLANRNMTKGNALDTNIYLPLFRKRSGTIAKKIHPNILYLSALLYPFTVDKTLFPAL